MFHKCTKWTSPTQLKWQLQVASTGTGRKKVPITHLRSDSSTLYIWFSLLEKINEIVYLKSVRITWQVRIVENEMDRHEMLTRASSSTEITRFPSFSNISYADRACCSHRSVPSNWCTLMAAAQNSGKSIFLNDKASICKQEQLYTLESCVMTIVIAQSTHSTLFD